MCLSAYAQKIDIKVGLTTSDSFFYDPRADVVGVQEYLINTLNKHQEKYNFTGIALPRKRQQTWLIEGKIDTIFLYNKSWGFDHPSIVESMPILKAKSLMIAVKKQSRGQEFFQNKFNKKFIGVRGYEYDLLKKSQTKIDITYVDKESIVPEMILRGRGEIGIINGHVLFEYFDKNPSAKEMLLISKVPEQSYTLNVLLNKNSKLKIAEVNKYLTRLNSQNKLDYIFRKYLGAKVNDIFERAPLNISLNK